MKVAWLMLDGVGLAAHTPQNPFSDMKTPVLDSLGISKPVYTSKPDFITRPIDAKLGIPGLPQSGTGQTSLLTGVNAAQRLGYHHGPWPGPTLKPLLEESVLIHAARCSKVIRLANLYPRKYLEAIAVGKHKLNAVALAATNAGATLEQHGIPPPLTDPNQPDAISVAQVQAWGQSFVEDAADIVIFDSWWSDHLGHEMNLAHSKEHIIRLEAFLTGALEVKSLNTLLLVTSDHGNFENANLKTHTFTDVPFAAIGTNANTFSSVRSLCDVAPALELFLKI